VSSYVVYGAGAVGGVIGARLHLAGHDVTLVARGEHLARIRADGLRLDTADGVLEVRCPAADTAADVDWSAAPVVVLAVKSHQTEAALADLVRWAPAATPVV
jgi:2-dehydropantoate 2-reductase